MKNLLLLAALFLQATILFSQTKNPLDDGRKIKIPVVFHILYRNTEQNIPDSLITNELKDLNLDFSRSNDMTLLDKDFRNLVGNPNVEFYLLDSTFTDSDMKGVQRIAWRRRYNENNILVMENVCLNVFVSNQGNSTPYPANRIYVNYEDVGIHSSALTHETGHWLGLYHIFGKIKNSKPWRVKYGDNNDEIDDTPEQRGATAACYTITKWCPCPPENITFNGHKTLYNNFMDYNPCRCMFTIGQSIQMRNDLIENRRSLFDNSK